MIQYVRCARARLIVCVSVYFVLECQWIPSIDMNIIRVKANEWKKHIHFLTNKLNSAARSYSFDKIIWPCTLSQSFGMLCTIINLFGRFFFFFFFCPLCPVLASNFIWMLLTSMEFRLVFLKYELNAPIPIPIQMPIL